MFSARVFTVCATLMAAVASQAVIINISTALNANPVQVTVGSLTHVGKTVNLAAGTYWVTPIRKDVTPGALYTAPMRFSSVNLPDTGYEWNVYVSTDGASTGTKHGYGEGSPSVDSPYQSTALAAFNAAPAPFQLTYAVPTAVTFYWRDDNFGDNSDGVSLSVDAVPEPVTMGLAALGLGVALKRRRK